MKTFLNADPRQRAQDHKIFNERYTNIPAKTVLSLIHDIYFANSLVIVNENTSEILASYIDYTFEEKDELASKLSSKDCFRSIKFLKAFNSISISYHAYGDVVKAEDMNLIFSYLNVLETPRLPDYSTQINYRIGSIVWKDEILYRAAVDMLAGPWIKSNWLVVVDSPIQKKTVYGDGQIITFEVEGIPETAHGFKFDVNELSLDKNDYHWTDMGNGTYIFKAVGWVPMYRDKIDIIYRK
jgi:hypothetical protein